MADSPGHGMYGLGVDEDAAILIEKSGASWSWTVYATEDPDPDRVDRNVYLVLPHAGARLGYDDHGRLTFGPLDVYLLKGGQTTAVKFADLTRGKPTYQLNVFAGTLFTTDNDGDLYGGLG